MRIAGPGSIRPARPQGIAVKTAPKPAVPSPRARDGSGMFFATTIPGGLGVIEATQGDHTVCWWVSTDKIDVSYSIKGGQSLRLPPVPYPRALAFDMRVVPFEGDRIMHFGRKWLMARGDCGWIDWRDRPDFASGQALPKYLDRLRDQLRLGW